MCAVSGGGVGCLLRRNPKLHALRLLQCVGPFGPEMLRSSAATEAAGDLLSICSAPLIHFLEPYQIVSFLAAVQSRPCLLR